MAKEEEIDKSKQDAIMYIKMKKDPFLFIKTMWGFDVQRDIDEPFIKGKMITRQQKEIVQILKDAVNDVGNRKISIKS